MTTERSAVEARAPIRVLVLVDASPDALQALEAAAELARLHDVPLIAVTVEEPDRVRSAAYSFAVEIGAVSGSIRAIDEALLIRRRERGPAMIRRAIEQIAGAVGVAWKLVVVRGRLVDEVLALSEPGDFVVLGRVGWSARLGRKLGSSSLLLARRALGTVQICSARPMHERGRIAVLVEDADTAGLVLSVAADRAIRNRREVTLLLSPSAGAEADRLAAVSGRDSSRWRRRVLRSLASGELLRALGEEAAVELLVCRGGRWLQSPAAASLLAHWPMPLLVVGEPPAEVLQSSTISPAGSRRL